MLMPDNLTARYNIALAQLRLGKFDTAKELYIETRKLNLQQEKTIRWGAVNDLRELRNLGIKKDEVEEILDDIFEIDY